jgi:vacuolar-type H+-ATPase subunit I/STV1
MDNKFYNEITDSLKLVFDLTSRIDERVKLLIENQHDAESRIEKIIEKQETIAMRLIALENKNGTEEHINELKKEVKELNNRMNSTEKSLNTLELNQTQHTNRWRALADIIFKIIVMVTGAFILFKLGIKP